MGTRDAANFNTEGKIGCILVGFGLIWIDLGYLTSDET